MTAVTTTENKSLALTEEDLERVLQSSLYPGASLPSIRMAIEYCRAAKLDPLQKPVHIVPMWDSKLQGMRDVIMPGINLYRTQAARSGTCAGVSEPRFGPDVDDHIGGVDITYPQWCTVTVKRLLASGIVAEFTATEYWLENYAVKGGKEKSIAPNAMWFKRPRGQLAKCATAQALRAAFPEFAAPPTAEEMDGKELPEYAPEPPKAPPGPRRRSEAPPPVAAAEPPRPEQAQDEQQPRDEASPPAAVSSSQSNGTNGTTISTGQVAYLRKKLAAAGVAESTVCAKYEIGDLSELSLDAFDTERTALL